MPLSKCVRCEKLFNKIQNVVCPICLPDEDADFDLIRTHLDENPDSNAETLAELSGVSIECVMRMIDQGSISNITIGSNVKCGQCGEPAISNRKKLCQTCLEKLNAKMLQASRSIQLDQRKKLEIGGYSSVRQTIDSKRI